MTGTPAARYRAAELVDFAAGLLRAAGLEEEKAQTVAAVLVEGDLLGHTTHGLALAAPYLQAIADGGMTRQGTPDVVFERGGTSCWDGRRLPGPWLAPWALTAEGEASDDPNVLFTKPPGTLLPTGGLDHGHKGYNLALAIEALSQGLSGHGRADPPTRWGASVYVQVMDPAAFGGADNFIRQTSFIAKAGRGNPAAQGALAVRLPGQQGLARKRQALSEGVPPFPGIMEQLASWGVKLAVAAPQPLA